MNGKFVSSSCWRATSHLVPCDNHSSRETSCRVGGLALTFFVVLEAE